MAGLPLRRWSHTSPSDLLAELDLKKADRAELERIFLQRSAAEWESWAAERDLPLVAVRS